MAEEVGIVMSLYDKVSPTLKNIAGNTNAFDKSLDELEDSLKSCAKGRHDAASGRTGASEQEREDRKRRLGMRRRKKRGALCWA